MTTGNNVSLFLTDHYIRFPLTLQSAAQAKSGSGSSLASRQQLLFNYFVPTVEYFVGLANIFSII